MKQPAYNNNWSSDIKTSYYYDGLEVFDTYKASERAYAYAYSNRFKTTLNAMRKHVPAGGRILDVAAAQGNFSLSLAEQGYKVTWNDLRKELIEYVKTKHEFGEVEYRAGNAFELEIEEVFDAVLITEIIEHVAHPDEFLRKVSNLVKPGGHIIMTTPLGSYFLNDLPRFSDCADPSVYESVQFKPNSDGHIFLLHLEEIESLSKKAGLKILDYQMFSNPLTAGHLKLSYLLRLLPQNLVLGMDKISQKLPVAISQKLHSAIFVIFEVPK